MRIRLQHAQLFQLGAVKLQLGKKIGVIRREKPTFPKANTEPWMSSRISDFFPSHHVLSKPKKALSGWIFQGRISHSCTTAQLPDQTARNGAAEQIPSPLSPPARELTTSAGNLPPAWLKQQKAKCFTCMGCGERLLGKVHPCKQPVQSPY